jgi:hypothetical protein
MNPVMWFSNEVSEHITPVIRDFLIEVYEHPENYLDPESKESSSNQLIKFQMALKKIPNWTNTQIKKQIDDITTRCPGFKKLLVALFMSYINMLSNGIKTKSSMSKRLDVKLPSDETFVHTCFVTCAHDVYEDPYSMKNSEKERNEDLDKRIQKCVIKSIHKLIPTMDIINNYIPSVGEGEVSLGGDDECMSQQQPEPTSTSTPTPTTPTETDELKKEDAEEEEDDEADEEPKTIKVPDSRGFPHQQQRRDEEDDLFPDAPDKISPTK